MGDRRAQEFWDEMWLWEKYEVFPSETRDDPHLVVQLASEVDAAGDDVDPLIFSRYDGCVGRVLQRLTDLFPQSGERLDEVELKHWLKFGLRADVRGHDQEITPIVDANSLVIFRFFSTHALQYAARHGRNDLRDLWQEVAEIARQVDDEHAGAPKASRFEPTANSHRAN
jgi:hypothetical protein